MVNYVDSPKCLNRYSRNSPLFRIEGYRGEILTQVIRWLFRKSAVTKQNRGQCQFAAGAKVFDRIQNVCSNVQLGMYLKYVRVFIYLLLYFKVTINCVATVTITYIKHIRNTVLNRLSNFHFETLRFAVKSNLAILGGQNLQFWSFLRP